MMISCYINLYYKFGQQSYKPSGFWELTKKGIVQYILFSLLKMFSIKPMGFYYNIRPFYNILDSDLLWVPSVSLWGISCKSHLLLLQQKSHVSFYFGGVHRTQHGFKIEVVFIRGTQALRFKFRSPVFLSPLSISLFFQNKIHFS